MKLIPFALFPCLFEPALVWFSCSSLFIFCHASWVDPKHVLCCYVGVQLLIFLLHSRWHRAVNRRIVPLLFCLPFANCASDSGDLYINFDRNQLIFPAALLVYQFEAWFNLFLPEHAYALHITSRISCHVLHHVACALHCGWLCLPLLVFLLWVEPGDEYVIEEPVKYAFEDQAYANTENFADKMTIPLKSLLSLLARCSLYCYAYATIPTTFLSCSPYCHVKPLTHLVLANRCLAILPLCSAPLIALLVAGEDWSCSLLEHD